MSTEQAPLTVGSSSSQTFAVTESDTARAMGSGDLPVLATPRLLAWFEAVTCSLLGQLVSVGTRVEVEHLLAAPIGAVIAVNAELAYLDGRLHRFAMAGHDQSGRLVATGTITRVVVDRERFMNRLTTAK